MEITAFVTANGYLTGQYQKGNFTKQNDALRYPNYIKVFSSFDDFQKAIDEQNNKVLPVVIQYDEV